MSEIELPEPYGQMPRRVDPREYGYTGTGYILESVDVYTAEQVRQLLAAERERCAQIAESTIVAEYEGVDCYGDKAAEAIRRGSV